MNLYFWLRLFWHWSVAGTGGAGANFSEMLVWNLPLYEALQWRYSNCRRSMVPLLW